jgi:Cu/Ag efflux protein CusF
MNQDHSGVTARRAGWRGVGRLAGLVLLGGCASSAALEWPEQHPANPRAQAGTLTASVALASYRSPSDFAGRTAQSGGDAPALTGTDAGHGAGHSPGPVAQAAGAKPAGVGTVNGVNAAKRTVNLSHEPIPSVGWPAMTMDLPVAPSVDLTAVKPGTRVTFTLARGADGLFLIDSIAPGPAGPGGAAPGSGAAPGTGSMPGMGHGSGGHGGMPAPPSRPKGTTP